MTLFRPGFFFPAISGSFELFSRFCRSCWRGSFGWLGWRFGRLWWPTSFRGRLSLGRRRHLRRRVASSPNVAGAGRVFAGILPTLVRAAGEAEILWLRFGLGLGLGRVGLEAPATANRRKLVIGRSETFFLIRLHKRCRKRHK